MTPTPAAGGPPAHPEPSDFVVGRLPLFATAWVLSIVTWSAVLAESGVALAALVVARAAEVVVLIATWIGARRTRTERTALLVVVGGCVVLGWIELTLFVQTLGAREVLGAMLLTLYSVAAFAFAWGWRIEALLVAPTLLPTLAVLPWLAPPDHPVEFHTAVAFGTVVAFAAAELTARNLAQARDSQRTADLRASELAASRDAYRDLAENVRDFIWAVDLEGRWTYINTAFERFFGIPRSELIGSYAPALTVDHPAAADAAEEIRRFVAGEAVGTVRFLFKLSSGLRWVEALPSGMYAADGTLVGIQGVSRDVTERMVVDTQLRESEAKFRMVAEAMAIPVFLVRGTQILYMNDASVRMLGYGVDELLAMPFQQIVHPDDRALVMERATARQRGEDVPPGREYRVITAGGEVRWIEFNAVLIDYQGEPAILGNAIDVTERKLAEEALRTSLTDLRASEERLRLLARRQVAIREDERKRIGFDLHDGVCQELIGVSILIASIRERLQPDAIEAAATIGRAVGYVTDVVEHLRVLARELRPMLLHDLGLEASLTALAKGLAAPDRPIEIQVATGIPRLPEDVELAVYRIAQEALTNAVRHADAKRIVLSVTAVRDHLRLEVHDDGRGFEPNGRSTPALGLAGMQERATALGGRFTIDSTPGRGTTIALEWTSARTSSVA
jgi:PAS domain S-box-containing protein